MTIDDFAVLVQNEFQIMREELATKEELNGLRLEMLDKFAVIQQEMATKQDIALLTKRTDHIEEMMQIGFRAVIAEIQDICAHRHVSTSPSDGTIHQCPRRSSKHFFLSSDCSSAVF